VAPPLIAIVGPTASGKSALALRLAREREGEIVSCDSLQVYRGLDVGSAKATAGERREIPHHLIDVVDPDEPFSAAEYARRARCALGEISARGRLPIVAGGSGLYLAALLDGLFEGPSRDEGLRERLDGLAERFGDARLHRLLAHVDPEAARRIQAHDRVRIVRALEVYRATGRPISAHHRTDAEPLRGYRVLLLGLNPGRAELRRAVERRTREMLERGLVDEVRALLARAFGPELRPLQAIGYRQALSVLRGETGLEEAERSIVTETMRFAKRQMTWFRHQAEVMWFTDAESAHAASLTWLDEGHLEGGPPACGSPAGAKSLTERQESVEFGGLRPSSMLVIEIPRIPTEGLDVDEALEPASLHVEGEDDFSLRAGGRLRCRLEMVDGSTVHVRGTLTAPLDVECGRCLDQYAFGLEQALDLFYLPRDAARPEEQEEDVELNDRDVVVGYHDGERLDLGEVVREQLVLALPLKRLCHADCKGLCPSCGRNRNRESCGCPAAEEPADPRLEPLRKLFDPDRH
jgi:tRNA dimethylallyltransferase